MLTDGQTTDAGVTGILIAHLGAFGSGELKSRNMRFPTMWYVRPAKAQTSLRDFDQRPLLVA